MAKVRHNSSGHTEGEKVKKANQVLKKKSKGKRVPFTRAPLNGSCYLERFGIVEF